MNDSEQIYKLYIESFNDLPDNYTHIDKVNHTTYYFYRDKKGKVVKHRTDGPAVVTDYGVEEYYNHGKIYKLISSNKTINYFDNNGQLHKDDGPAIIYPDNEVEWWIHGKYLDGFALEQHIKKLEIRNKLKSQKNKMFNDDFVDELT